MGFRARLGDRLMRRAGWALGAAVLLLVSATALRAQGAPPKKLAASLARLFGPAARRDSLVFEGAVVYRVYQGDSLVGFAQVRNVKGKDQPITYLVALDPGGRLKDVDILAYREPYGGEVAYEPWRRQFRGKSADDPLEVGRDIRAISGATISVNAVTAGVRQALADFRGWRLAGLL